MAATISPQSANHTYITGLEDDGRLDVFVDRRGIYGDKMSRREFKHIRKMFQKIEDITGIDIKLGTGRRFSRRSELDIIQTDLDNGLLGYWQPEEWGAVITYQDTGRSYIERSTITHEIGHAFGLGHPAGGGADPNYTTYDTIMSYNDVGYVNFSPSDIATLEYIWG